MPYATIAELPLPVRRHLPVHAQEIYRAAFNQAYAAHREEPGCEQTACRIAWAAVKRCYVKAGVDWIPRF